MCCLLGRLSGQESRGPGVVVAVWSKWLWMACAGVGGVRVALLIPLNPEIRSLFRRMGSIFGNAELATKGMGLTRG